MQEDRGIMDNTTILQKIRRIDDMLAKAEVNLRGTLLMLDELAEQMGFARGGRLPLPDKLPEPTPPYPQLTEQALNSPAEE